MVAFFDQDRTNVSFSRGKKNKAIRKKSRSCKCLSVCLHDLSHWNFWTTSLKISVLMATVIIYPLLNVACEKPDSYCTTNVNKLRIWNSNSGLFSPVKKSCHKFRFWEKMTRESLASTFFTNPFRLGWTLSTQNRRGIMQFKAKSLRFTCCCFVQCTSTAEQWKTFGVCTIWISDYWTVGSKDCSSTAKQI